MNQINVIELAALIEIAFSSAIFLLWGLELVFRINSPGWVRMLFTLVLANIFFWPLDLIGLPLELPLGGYVRGITGDLSTVTTLILWTGFFAFRKQPAPIILKVFIVLVAAMFYPLSLGVGMVDPYSWGYAPSIFLVAIFAIALLAWVFGWYRGVWILGFAVGAWSCNWHESSNLWDYLLDPFLVLWASWGLVHFAYRGRRKKARSGYLFRAG